MNQPQTIRHDIDGLRAIAVLVVMFFHAGLTDFRGGFIGVDVFFTISGFLILPQIIAQGAAGRFTVAGFLARRVRRLVPALLPVLAYTLIAATLLLGSGAYQDFLRSLAGAAAYVSNYVLMAQSGYFERTSDTLLLLHTWSLSVEFQFYILAPLILLLARGRMVLALALLSLASLVLAIWLVAQGSPWAFFGILPRFWELALGGLVGLWCQRLRLPEVTGIALRLAGLAAILTATHLYRNDMAFPGMAAVLPVLGTALILLAPATPRDPLLWLLNSRVMQWVGTRSYSLYLWHWPLIVTVTLFAIHPTEGHYVAALLLAFPLAELSYRYVENPVRRGLEWRGGARMAGLTLLPPALMLALWAGMGRIEPLRQYLPLDNTRQFRNLADQARQQYMQTELGDGAGRQCSFDTLPDHTAMRGCLLLSPRPAPVLVIGDSHGRDTFQALRRAFPDQPMLLLHQSGCAPADYVASAKSHCFAGLPALLAQTLPDLQPKAVILTSYWPAKSLPALPATLDALANTPTAIVNATPVFRADVANLLRQMRVAPTDIKSTLSSDLWKTDVTSINRKLAVIGDQTQVPVIDKYAAFCAAGECTPYARAGDLVWWDDQHLSVPAIEYLSRRFASDPALTALLR